MTIAKVAGSLMEDNMALNFESDPVTVSTVFNRFYQIPPYQRDYEWGMDQIDDLWNDIMNAIENKADHFLGAFVFKGEKGKDTTFEVMDGQQRLITLTILLASIRDNLDVLGEKKLAKGAQVSISSPDKSGNETYKLILNRSAGKYIEELIQKYETSKKILIPQSQEEKKIKSTYEYFYKKINEKLNVLIDVSDKISFLKELKEKIEEIYVIGIYVVTEEDAYTIFEVLNDRGLELSVADLLKNLIFKKYKQTKIKDAEDTWRKMIHLFENRKINFTKFLRHFWISKYRFISTPELFKDIKKETQAYDFTQTSNFLSEIDNESRAYTSLSSPDQLDFSEFSQKKKDVLEILLNIKLFDVKQCYSLMLALYRAVNSKKISKQQFIDALKVIEDFTFVYIVILEGRTSSLEEIFSSSALKIKKSDFEYQGWMKDLKSEFSKLSIDYDRFYEELKKVTYISHKPSIIRYIFTKIEFSGENNLFNFYNASIEHIYPDSGGDEKVWPKLSTDKQEEEYLKNNLGNLALLHPDDNQFVNTDSYKIKEEEYKKCKAKITSAIPKDYSSVWNKETIVNRRDKLIKFIKDKGIWKI